MKEKKYSCFQLMGSFTFDISVYIHVSFWSFFHVQDFGMYSFSVHIKSEHPQCKCVCLFRILSE